MPVFPSVEWFEAVRDAANGDPAFRRLGTADAHVGVKVGDSVYVLDFEAFECAGVSQVEEHILRDVDFYLDMTPEDWQSLLTNVRENGGADSEHTFNTLDVESGIVESSNPYGMNNFPRYHVTLQRFFDVSAQVETTFE